MLVIQRQQNHTQAITITVEWKCQILITYQVQITYASYGEVDRQLPSGKYTLNHTTNPLTVVSPKQSNVKELYNINETHSAVTSHNGCQYQERTVNTRLINTDTISTLWSKNCFLLLLQ